MSDESQEASINTEDDHRGNALLDKVSRMEYEQFTRFMATQLAGCLDKFDLFEQKLTFFMESHSSLEKKLDENSAMTKQVMESTSGLVSTFNDTKQVVSIFSAIGNFVRRTLIWLGPMFAAGTAIYAFLRSFKTGEPPHQG